MTDPIRTDPRAPMRSLRTLLGDPTQTVVGARFPKALTASQVSRIEKLGDRAKIAQVRAYYLAQGYELVLYAVPLPPKEDRGEGDAARASARSGPPEPPPPVILSEGRRLAAKRESSGLSQPALGELLEVSRSMVASWEADRAPLSKRARAWLERS